MLWLGMGFATLARASLRRVAGAFLGAWPVPGARLAPLPTWAVKRAGIARIADWVESPTLNCVAWRGRNRHAGGRMRHWTPSTWRDFPAAQQPDWPDEAALERAVKQIAGYPPL